MKHYTSRVRGSIRARVSPVNSAASRVLVLLLALLPACATRAPAPGAAPYLTERQATRLISLWQREVRHYIDLHGDGDPAVLLGLRALRSRDAPRPGRIVFGVLDVEASLPGRDGWDVQGVLVGKHAEDGRNLYAFLVGIVRRSDYRPREVQDVRLVVLSSSEGKLGWQTDDRTPDAVQRYRDTYAGSATIRFPGDTDQFTLTGAGWRVSVREVRSGAQWSLYLRPADAADG
jgi:hypothetical protein